MRHRITQGHQKLCDSTFSVHPQAKTEGKYLLVKKKSYKYCNISSHSPKNQYTKTLKSLLSK